MYEDLHVFAVHIR